MFNEYLYMNWGWGGLYNGWFKVSKNHKYTPDTMDIEDEFALWALLRIR